MKIRPVGAELFHAEGQTSRHMTKLTDAVRNFTKAPKKPIMTIQVGPAQSFMPSYAKLGLAALSLSLCP